MARKIVRSPLRTTLFATNRPLIKLEKQLVEPFSRHLRQSAVFDVVDRLSPALEAIGVLLIPLVLYLATQAYEEQREAQEIERLQQETVSNYLGQLSEIFLNVDEDLRSDENRRIKTIVTASTITLLRDPNLDGQRKGQIIEFLSQMNLVQGDEPSEDNAGTIPLIINLHGADLHSTNLREASLSAIALPPSFRDANFYSADLDNIQWNEDTRWPSSQEVANARNIPEALKQQLGIK